MRVVPRFRFLREIQKKNSLTELTESTEESPASSESSVTSVRGPGNHEHEPNSRIRYDSISGRDGAAG
jgi:hypothetical protein